MTEPAKTVIGVIGSASPTDTGFETARQVGRLLAEYGAVILCGGLSGVMEAACKGAREGGGLSVGLLPGRDSGQANPYVTIPLPTGLGHTRNAVIARAASGLVAIEGGLGTVSEAALGLKMGKPVVGLDNAFSLPGLISVDSPQQAVDELRIRLNL